MKIKYLGHSAFLFSTTRDNILVDPFFAANPSYKPENIKNIFLTHGHGDHVGDAVKISKAQNSIITAIFELANYCQSKGAFANGVSFGGKLNFPWGWAVFTPAFHSSSTPDGQYAGMPASIVLEIGGVTIYHAGDTCLNSEMSLIKELYSPKIALLPIGGHFTMDIEHAAIAAKKLGVETAIPMHYNTFSPINANPADFKALVERNGQNVVILNINQELTIQ